MKSAFLDEAGDVNPFTGSRSLVVALLATDAPRAMVSAIKGARKRLHPWLAHEELKASSSQPRVVASVLDALASLECAIVAVTLDRRGTAELWADREEVYRLTVACTVRQAVLRWPDMALTLDKRYTKAGLRDHLETSIRQGLVDTPQGAVLIRQEDSRTHKELQAVDMVAWALFQKYERGEDRFYRLIAERIVSEQVIGYVHLQALGKQKRVP